jgi:hypothetical protein
MVIIFYYSTYGANSYLDFQVSDRCPAFPLNVKRVQKSWPSVHSSRICLIFVMLLRLLSGRRQTSQFDRYFSILQLQLPFILKKTYIMSRRISFRKGSFVFGILAFVGIAFSSCKKDNLETQPVPVAGLMVFNLSPDQSPVSVSLSGNQLPTGPIAYPAFSGRYLNIYAGNRRVESFGASAQLLDTVTYNFEPNKYYSVFVVGADDNYRNIVSYDNYDSLTASSGKAYVRYINALPNAGSSSVSITAGATVVNNVAPFGQVSSFTAVDPGNVTINVINEGVPAVNRTVTLAGQKAYTVLITGLPNQADSARTVQIRFIENGTVTD